MYWNDGGAGWWWIVPMIIVMVVVVGAVVWAVLANTQGSASGGHRPESTPEEVLAQRFAHGDIDSTEYHEKLDTLHDTRR